MNIILSGYGKMGHAVETAALTKGHQIIGRLDNEASWADLATPLPQGTVVIDFSTPDSAVSNIRRAFDLRLPIIVGTTGWYGQLPVVKKWCLDEGQSLLYGTNFSIGMNIFFELNRSLAGYLDRFEAYDISLEEIHHIHKLDSPSGTAIRLAEDILKNSRRKKSWKNSPASSPAELGIISRREGEEPGTHIVRCESDDDRIELTHQAKGRTGFASGAILAGEWLLHKKGFFEMKDLLNFKD